MVPAIGDQAFGDPAKGEEAASRSSGFLVPAGPEATDWD